MSGVSAQQKPQQSFWQIWNMCFGFFGIQIGFALQNANVSRIFQTLGAEIDDIAILWIAAPLTGLLVQPVIGYMSDRTWGRMGRRHPYFFFGAVASTLALFVMPNAPLLWMAAGMLWIMDASINVTMEPFRAFVGDMLPDGQRTKGFAMQSFFIGTGSVLASALPWVFTNIFGVANTAPEGVVPPSVEYAFYIGGGLLLVAVLWTVFSTKEYSPEELAAFEHKAKAGENADKARAQAGGAVSAAKLLRGGFICLALGGAASVLVYQFALEKELYVLTVGGVLFGVMLAVAGLLQQRGRTDNAFSDIISDMMTMPYTMKQLALVQFFSWFALFSMWIYTTPGVAAYHFKTTDAASQAYNDGADWVGILFAVYNGVAALAAFAIPVLARATSRTTAHAVCLCFGALGLVSMLLIADPDFLWISMVGVGIAWASILSVPYAILSATLPAQKMGVYMGIFNFFIVIPQLTAASILGVLVRYVFAGEAIYALVAGGVSLLLAAGASLLVFDPRAKAHRAEKQAHRLEKQAHRAAKQARSKEGTT